MHKLFCERARSASTSMRRLYTTAGATQLSGLTALVTGASGGIGGAVAREFSRRGAKLVLTGRSSERLLSLADALNSERGSALHSYVSCDMQELDDIKKLTASSLDILGRIDILVNAAGISRDGLILRQAQGDLDAMLQTNLIAPLALTKHVAAHMVRRRTGSIINISSVVGMHGNAGQSGYAATKAGLIGATKALAKELAPRGVRVNAIAPGFIDTGMTKEIADRPATKKLLDTIPLGRMGVPEDVAHGASYLAEAPYITGQVLVIDGGLFI